MFRAINSAVETHSNTLNDVTTILWLVITATIVAIITKYIRLPYTIVLVLAGVGIALVPGIPTVILTPELIVNVFLPVLLFEAAYHLSYEHLKESFRFIAGLAVLGVLGTAAFVAGFLILVVGMQWQTALLFGAIVSATDPVSVVATFRKLGTPYRLTTIVEGESLFNDGSALVFFNLLLGVVVAEKFSVWGSLTEFLVVSVGGLILGIAVGYLALLILARLNDHLTETLLTLIAAYGSFIGAEELGVSPALAVVATGLLIGNFGHSQVMAPTTQIALGYSWEFFGFLANSLIFLLMGLEIRAINFTDFWQITLVGIGVTILSRIIMVGVSSWLTNTINRRVLIPLSWQVMMIWGGLRGAVSLSMALSLPLVLASGAPFPERDKLLVMSFGLILFTLVVQGLTIEPLMNYLKLGRATSEQIRRYELLRGQLLITRTVSQKTQEMLESGLINEDMAKSIIKDYQAKEDVTNTALAALHVSNELLQEEQLHTARRQLLEIEKTKAKELYSQGIISEEILQSLQTDIDSRSVQLEQSEPT